MVVARALVVGQVDCVMLPAILVNLVPIVSKSVTVQTTLLVQGLLACVYVLPDMLAYVVMNVVKKGFMGCNVLSYVSAMTGQRAYRLMDRVNVQVAGLVRIARHHVVRDCMVHIVRKHVAASMAPVVHMLMVHARVLRDGEEHTAILLVSKESLD